MYEAGISPFDDGLTAEALDAEVIVDPVITYTFASLCELVNLRLMEAQANSLCYKCKHIFGFYYKAQCVSALI